jgi:hypothetical protein
MSRIVQPSLWITSTDTSPSRAKAALTFTKSGFGLGGKIWAQNGTINLLNHTGPLRRDDDVPVKPNYQKNPE